MRKRTANFESDGIARFCFERKIPVYVFLELTRSCNLRCKHCYIVQENRPELSANYLKGVINQLRKEKTLILNFSGGEVFLRKDFFEVARHAKKEGFAIKIFTNGTLIDKEEARELKALKPLRIEITIFSLNPLIHDRMTGVSGSLGKSLKALSLLKRAGIPLRIKSPLTNDTFSGYQEIIRLAQELEIKYQFDPNIIPKLNGLKSHLDLRIGESRIKSLLKDNKVNVGSDLIFEGNGRDTLICSAGHNSCAISAYGDVFPCIIMPINLGNVRKKEFSEIWHNGRILRKIRNIKYDNLRECIKCSYAAFCNRCPGMAYLEKGDVRGCSERLLEIARIKYRILKRKDLAKHN